MCGRSVCARSARAFANPFFIPVDRRRRAHEICDALTGRRRRGTRIDLIVFKASGVCVCVRFSSSMYIYFCTFTHARNCTTTTATSRIITLTSAWSCINDLANCNLRVMRAIWLFLSLSPSDRCRYNTFCAHCARSPRVVHAQYPPHQQTHAYICRLCRVSVPLIRVRSRLGQHRHRHTLEVCVSMFVELAAIFFLCCAFYFTLGQHRKRARRLLMSLHIKRSYARTLCDGGVVYAVVWPPPSRAYTHTN